MMPAQRTFHDLLVGPAGVSGDHSPGIDTALCADIARATAQAARVWAADDVWTGLGGFDATGAFWLAPAGGDTLAFRRSESSLGWLRLPVCQDTDEPAAEGHDAIGEFFPRAAPPDGFHAPASYSCVQTFVRGLPGFGGCALRHPANGVWKTVIAPADTARLNHATRTFTPIARMLQAQALPVGRLYLAGERQSAFAFRTPSKIYGYLHLGGADGLAAAASLADELLRCAAQTELVK
jgi:hypothetical protein